MKTILTPIDFSGATRGVIDTAAGLAAAVGARLVLLHSLQPPMLTTDYGIGMEVLQEALAVSEKAATRQLEHIQTELEGRGLTIATVLQSGAAAPAILEQAGLQAADFIVLGSHGHTAFYDLMVGSTTHAVLLKAPCPVVIVPPAPGKKKKS